MFSQLKRVSPRLIVLLTVVMLFVILPAMQAQDKVTIRFAFWGLPEEAEVQEQLKAAFEAEHPNIEVQLDHVASAGEFPATMLTQISGGNPPDVFYIGEALVRSFVEKNVLLDLKPYIERDGIDTAAYWPAAINPMMDGEEHLWAFPKDNTPFMIYYNKRLFDEAGLEYPTADWTWDNMVTDAQALTQDKNGDGKIDQWGLTPDLWWGLWITTVYANGGTVLNAEHNKCTLTEPAAVEALQDISDLMNTENPVAPSPDVMSNMGVGTIDLFLGGTSAMMTAGRWGAFFIKPMEDQWGVVPYPTISTPNNVALFVTLAVPQTSAHPDEAWEFIKFVAGANGQAINASTGLGLPVLQDLTEEGTSWLLPGEPEENAALFTEAMSRASSLPFHSQWAQTIDEIAARELDALWRGKSNAEEVTAKICEQVDPLIADN